MRINKKGNDKKKIIATILVLLLVSLVGTALYIAPSLMKKQEQTKRDQEQKKARQQSNTEKKQYIENKGATQSESPQTAPTSSDSIAISAEKTNTDTVTVYTKLYGFPGGVCELSVANGTKQYSKTVDIIYQPEYSTCAGFSIPFSALGSGLWQITLKATPSSGEPLTKTYQKEI